MPETIAAEVIARDLFVGRTSDGARLFVTIELREQAGDRATIDHGRVNGYRELSVTGSGISKYRREPDFGGQCIDSLRDVATRAVSQPAGPRRELRDLADIWERWHLNGMRAGCAHQTPVGETAGDRLDQTPACPDTGYRWGSAWLVEPLPDAVVDDLRRIVAALS